MSLVAWFRLPRAQQGMALEAAAWLTLARVLVHHVPMRYWRGSLHTAASGQASAGRCALGRTLGRMVAGVARRLPFEAPCLPRALATQWMLRRRGVASRLVFGVRRAAPGEPADYHAWLTVDGRFVSGGRNAPAFTPLPVPSPRPAGGSRRGRVSLP